jgi:hypothetical protein
VANTVVDSSKESSCESTSWRIEEAGLIVTMLAYLITNTEYFKEILHNLCGMTIFAFMISNKIKELKAIEEREKSAQELFRYENL